MSNVIELFKQKGKFDFQYIMDDGSVIGITHEEWPFRIMRNQDKIAIVCEETDQPFGILDADVFNTLLGCWLLIDDPSIIDKMAGD